MGVTVQWRGEPEREPHTYGKAVTFGNLRDKGSGYMAYSERIGPGIVVLAPHVDTPTKTFADALMNGGFTVLVPDLGDLADARAVRVAVAATEHLLDNWHPRIGLVAFDTAVAIAQEVAAQRALDATAFFDSLARADVDKIAEDFAYDLS